MTLPRFNYIITIHDKQDLIEEVLVSVLLCAREGSRIFAVLDGCTDRTEAVIDGLGERYSGLPIEKVVTPDVHELRTINAGLRAADQGGEGFNVILQDDVVLADFELERKVQSVYAWAGPKLAYLSFRLGAEFAPDALASTTSVPLRDYLENAHGHGLVVAQPLLTGWYARRTLPIKSPVCLPFWVVREVGVFDERLAPYGHDDTDLALRLFERGYENGVFALRFYSDVKWGGTRTSPHPEMNATLIRNMGFIREWHPRALEEAGRISAAEPVPVPGLSSDSSDRAAMALWRTNRKALEDLERRTPLKALAKLVRRLRSAAGLSR